MTVADMTPLELYSVIITALYMGVIIPILAVPFYRDAQARGMMFRQKVIFWLYPVFTYGINAWVAVELIARG